ARSRRAPIRALGFIKSKFWTARWFVLVMLGVSMAVQFDWPGYYIALFVVFHAFMHGLRHHRGLLDLRIEYVFCAVFSVVVLANFYLFYRFIVDLRGDFSEMMDAAGTRSGSPDGYFDQLVERMHDLHGWIPMVLVVVWLVYFFVKWARRQNQLGDLIPLYFLMAQIIHSLMFKQAGFIHSYWTYHINPAMAVGGAVILLGAARWIPRFLADCLRVVVAPLGRLTQKRVYARALAPLSALGALIVVVPLWVQTGYAFEQMRWGFQTGDASYVEPYNDRFLETRWAQEIAREFNRDNTDFRIHTGLEWRIETLWYLDAPHTFTTAIPRVSHSQSERNQVMLFDLSKVSDWDTVASAIHRYHTRVYDRRFVLINFSDQSGEFRSYVHVEDEPSIFWPWLVNPDRPPIRWVEDPDTELTRSLFDRRIEISERHDYGGHGGSRSEWNCPRGFVLSAMNIHITHSNDLAPSLLAQIRPECRSLEALLSRDAAAAAESTFEGPPLGRVEDGEWQRLECPENHALVGVHGRAGAMVDAVGIQCATVSEAADGTVVYGDIWTSPTVGGDGGDPFQFLCPDGSLGFAFYGRTGLLLDAYGLSCAVIDDHFRNGTGD
ncbi:MAG: hypothetical protein KC561_02525, partial [Myxococcales bacterium]|nr:hypothetical protein [Myxococcales bacterium]